MSALGSGSTTTSNHSIPHFKLIKEVVTGKQLVEQTTQTPNIAQPVSSYFLSSVVEISIYLSITTESDHLWTLDIESAFARCVELVHLRHKHMTLSEISNSHSRRTCR